MSSELAADVAAQLDRAFGQWRLSIGTLPQLDTFRNRDLSKQNRASVIPEEAIHELSSTRHDLVSEATDAHELPASPIHPIESLQEEFEESILDSLVESPQKTSQRLDGEARRRQMLELEDTTQDMAYSSRWTQRSLQKYHPLRKLVAQISYGIHLLHKDTAIDNLEVVAILQSHVDEVDNFLDDTLEDFALATKDIDERINHLKLPLEHSRTFNRMLCERGFRESILEGNEIIEKIIDKTTRSMNRSLKDIDTGIQVTDQLSTYLDKIETGFLQGNQDVIDVFLAMKDNAIGWKGCFHELQGKAADLSQSMLQLGYIVDEVAKRCGIASRRKTPMGVVGRRSIYPLPEETAGPYSSRIPATSSHFEKPLPAPPPRISTNPAGNLPRASILPLPQYPAAHRPSLSSSPSLQTLDCLYRSPQRPDFDSNRPSSSSSNTNTTRSVHFQTPSTTSSPLAHKESQVILHGPPRLRSHQQVSGSPETVKGREDVTIGSKAKIDATQDTMSTTTSRKWIGCTQPSHAQSKESLKKTNSTGTNQSNRGQIAPQPLKTPVVISSPLVQANIAPTQPPRASATGPRPSMASRSPPPITRKASFSIFPPVVDIRNTSYRPMTANTTSSSNADGPNASTVPTRKPIISIASSISTAVFVGDGATKSPVGYGAGDTEAKAASPSPQACVSPSDKFIVDGPTHAPSAYAHSAHSDVPTLSHSHHPSSSLATVSTSCPSTPDDPSDALRSHPVTPDLWPPPNHRMSITALPRWTSNLTSTSSLSVVTPLSDVEPESATLMDATMKKPSSLPKKTSYISMKSLFSRKSSNESTQKRSGSAGVGGLIAVT